MRIGLIQRVLAGYRVPFFDLLAERFDGQLSIFAGSPRPEEMIDTSVRPAIAKIYPADNLHLMHGKSYLCFQRKITAWLREWDPEALIVEANLRYPLTWQALRWMQQRGRPLVGWGLGTGASINWYKRSFLQKFDTLITYSQTGAESYRAAGIPEQRIFIAKNAVTRRPLESQLPARSNHFSDKPIVMFAGRLQERKRVDLLLEACAALDPAIQPLLWIVGDGPDRERLIQYAQTCYPAAVFWGALYGETLAEKFRSADLFVLPGTGGLALQQAMSYGLPVIAAEADGTQQDLIRPGNGIMVSPGNRQDLIDAMSLLLSDPVRLREMGKASFEIVRNEINLEAMADVFVQALDAARFAKKTGKRARE